MFGNVGAGISPQCKFGLPSLDEILGGGLPRGETWIIEDEIGSDTDPFVLSFLANGLQSMDYVYLLSTENVLDFYKHTFQTYGRNPDMVLRTGRLKFLDAFTGSYQMGLSGSLSDGMDQMSSVAQVGGDVSDSILKIPDITQTREINESIRRSLLHVQSGTSTGIRGGILSLSSLIHATQSVPDFFSFIQNRRSMDILRNSTSLLSLHADGHDPTFVRALEHQVSGVLKISNAQADDSTDVYFMVEVVHAKGKAEISNEKVFFRYSGGRLIPT